MRILGIGNPFLDRTTHTDILPIGLKKGGTAVVFEKAQVEELWKQTYGTGDYSWSLGGSCTNVMKALSQLTACFTTDFSCALLGMVGKDKKKEIEQKLKISDVESFLAEGNADNGIVNCFVTPDFQRTMQAFFGTSLELSKEHILPQYFEKCSHVHLEGYLAYFKDVLECSVEMAKEKETTISLDLSSVEVIENCSDQIKKCAEKVDIIFGNFKEMEKFTGNKDIKSIFTSFKKEQLVVITNGSKGGWLKAKDSDEVLQFEAEDTDHILDTTGAGDFFIAGFLAAFLNRTDLQSCIKIAKLAASYVIQQEGVDLPMQKWEELKIKIKKVTSGHVTQPEKTSTFKNLCPELKLIEAKDIPI